MAAAAAALVVVVVVAVAIAVILLVAVAAAARYCVPSSHGRHLGAFKLLVGEGRLVRRSLLLGAPTKI